MKSHHLTTVAAATLALTPDRLQAVADLAAGTVPTPSGIPASLAPYRDAMILSAYLEQQGDPYPLFPQSALADHFPGLLTAHAARLTESMVDHVADLLTCATLY